MRAARVSCLSVASTKRLQRRPYKQILPLLLLGMAIAAPLVIASAYGRLLSVGSTLLLIVIALRTLVGRGDVVSTMSLPTPGALELTSTDIIVRADGRAERFERASVAAGWVEMVHQSSYLVLQMKSGVVVRALVARREGEVLLEALGLAHDPRAVALVLGRPPPSELGNANQRTLDSAVLGCAGLFAGLMFLAGILGLIFSPLINEPLAGTIFRSLAIIGIFGPVTYYLWDRIRKRLPPVPTLARIGAEGVLLTRRRRRTWIPFTDLEQVVCQGGEVHFHLTGERKVSVIAANDSEAQAVVERVRAAQVWATRGSAAGRLAQLDRGARTIEEWRADLELLSPRGAGYRQAGIDGGDLAQVVEDGAAPAERRLAAALAIVSNKEDEELRRRVRIAAEASVNERLRVALIKAVEGELDDEAVEEALDESRQRARAS